MALKRGLFLSKQELYFVIENYEKFLQGKNKDRTVVGHIKELLVLFEFHPLFGHFEFVGRLGSY